MICVQQPIITNKIINKNEPKQKKILSQVLLGFYLCILFFGVWTSLTISNGEVCVNLELYEVYKDLNFSFNYSIKDFLINFAMLVPVGFYLNQFKLNIITIWYLGAVVGCIIEMGQFVLPINRVVQLMDVLTNGFSVVLGYTIAENTHKLLKNVNYYDKITK